MDFPDDLDLSDKSEWKQRELGYLAHRGKVWAAGNGRCSYCGIKCQILHGPRQGTIDHIVPRSRGGGNEFENLQLLCRSCNEWKGSHLVATKEEVQLGKLACSLAMNDLPDRRGTYRPAVGEKVWAEYYPFSRGGKPIWFGAVVLDATCLHSYYGMPSVHQVRYEGGREAFMKYCIPRVGDGAE